MSNVETTKHACSPKNKEKILQEIKRPYEYNTAKYFPFIDCDYYAICSTDPRPLTNVSVQDLRFRI